MIHWFLVVGEINISENEVVNPMIQQIPSVPPDQGLKSILLPIILFILAIIVAIIGFFVKPLETIEYTHDYRDTWTSGSISRLTPILRN